MQKRGLLPLRDSANRGGSLGFAFGSGVPAVGVPGLAEQAPWDDDAVGQADHGFDDSGLGVEDQCARKSR